MKEILLVYRILEGNRNVVMLRMSTNVMIRSSDGETGFFDTPQKELAFTC